ncbi:hypothetical protein BLOT_012128 [Blomia tropicalis]|nr:hypothetical protein BLOT_012128 [Blomia tropicalis]
MEINDNVINVLDDQFDFYSKLEIDNETEDGTRRPKQTRMKVIYLDCPDTKCMQKFKTKREVKAHLKEIHDDLGKIMCYFLNCHKTFRSFKNLKLHFEENHSKFLNKIYQCDKCSRTFNNMGGLRGHIWRLHERGLFQCIIEPDNCMVKTKTREMMEKHLHLYHSGGLTTGGTFSCQFCNLSFNVKNYFLIHQRNVHGKRAKGDNEDDDNYQDIVFKNYYVDENSHTNEFDKPSIDKTQDEQTKPNLQQTLPIIPKRVTEDDDALSIQNLLRHLCLNTQNFETNEDIEEAINIKEDSDDTSENSEFIDVQSTHRNSIIESKYYQVVENKYLINNEQMTIKQSNLSKIPFERIFK